MTEFKYVKYNKKDDGVIKTNVPPNPNGQDYDDYSKPTGLRDKEEKDIFDGDKLIDEDGNKGTVISNIKIADGVDKKGSMIIFDNGVRETLDDKKCLRYRKEE